MKLSDLNPDDVSVVDQPSSAPLKLSDLNPDDIQVADEASSPLITPLEDSAPRTSDTDAILTGLAQGLTFKFSDELGGLKDALIDGKDYEAARDARRAANDQAYKDSPWITGAAEVAGSLPLMAVPGLNAAKGASLAQKVGMGAAIGGATGLGGSDSKDVGGMALDTGIGAAVGGAGAYVADKVVDKVTKLKSYLADKAREKAIDKAEDHLRFTPGMKVKLGQDKVRDAAKETLDYGAIKFGAKADDTATTLGQSLKELGAIKQQMVEEAQGTIDPIKLAQRIDDEVLAPLRGRPGMRKVLKQMENEKAAILKQFAPDYTPGGRLPGTPTTITRSKPQFIPQEPTIPFEDGLTPVGVKFTPEFDVSVVQSGTKPTVDGLMTEPAQQLQILNKGNRMDVINGYVTPEPTAPFKLDPKTGLPIKQVVERRIEGTAPAAPVTAKQIFQTKKDIAGNTNFLSTENQQMANKSLVNTLGRVEDELINDPRLKDVNNLYHKLSLADVAAERTGALTDGGGLFGHITDSAVNAATLNHLMHGNPVGLVAAAGRGLTKGRYDSAAAVGLNKLSQHLKSNPQAFGKYTKQLEQAAQRGTLPVIHYLLQQKDPNYRKTVQDLDKQN